MTAAVLSLLLLARIALAGPPAVHERQASDSAAFKSAADALISSYIPSSDFAVLSASVASAASAASITGNVNSLIYSALEASSQPPWFRSAVPTAYTTEIASLEAQINALRPSGSALPTPTVSETVVVVTGTNSEGSTFTTSFTTAVLPVTTTLITAGTGTSSGNTTAPASTSGSKTGSATSSSTNAASLPSAIPNNVAVGLLAMAGLAIAL